MSRRARPLAAVVLLTAAIAAAGCGDTHISNAKVQRLMHSTLRPTPSSITCPTGLHAKSGATFICQLHYSDGDTGTLTVHELDGAGHVESSPGDLRILTIGQQHAETVLHELVTKNHVGLHSISCPANIPADAGTLTCHVVDIHGLHATVTEHIASGGGLTINPATDIHVGAPKTRTGHR